MNGILVGVTDRVLSFTAEDQVDVIVIAYYL